ncbi:MAG TPA: hypothetical protein VGC42_09955, partial [Kofleriaceae bacterium]
MSDSTGAEPPLDETRSASERPDPRSIPLPPTDSARRLLLCNPDRYELIAEHGRGGLGRVSRAHDHGLGRDVAIKELIRPNP